MSRRPCARVAVLALCAACNFDPSALGGGGSNDGIGGDHGDASALGEDAMSLRDSAVPIDAQPPCDASSCPGTCDQAGAYEYASTDGQGCDNYLMNTKATLNLRWQIQG